MTTSRRLRRLKPSGVLDIPTSSVAVPREPSFHVKVFIVPDIHVPRHDARATETALGLLRDFRPDKVVIIGDFCDLEALSHHPKNRPDITHLSWEYGECNKLLDAFQNAAPSANWYFVEGNHEHRAIKFANNLGILDGFLDVPQNLHITPVADARRHDNLRGIVWLPFEDYLGRAWIAPWGNGAFGYLHSAKANKGGMAAGGLYHSAYHANTIGPISRCLYTVYGHHHTFQMFRSAAGYEAWCCGFLGDLNEKAFLYNAGPSNWLNGVMVQEIEGSLCTTTPITIANGKAVF